MIKFCRLVAPRLDGFVPAGLTDPALAVAGLVKELLAGSLLAGLTGPELAGSGPVGYVLAGPELAGTGCFCSLGGMLDP